MTVTIVIIIVTVGVSLLCFSDSELKYKLTFSPYAAKHHKKWYTVFSHALVHADYLHLFFNMFVLYSFGRNVEVYFQYYFGPKAIPLFILLYVSGVAFATLSAFKRHSENPNYFAVGASGAVSAVLYASIILAPFEGSISLIFLPIGIPPVVFGILYLIYEAYMDKKGRDNVAHDAHIWGAIWGVVFVIIFRPITALEFIDDILQIFN